MGINLNLFSLILCIYILSVVQSVFNIICFSHEEVFQ